MTAVRMPNLFIVGAPRCGTTSLYRYLGAHPDIFMSRVKEPHFFGSDLLDPGFIRDRDDYLALFDRAGDARFRGEASVWYLYSQLAAREIHEANSEARVLVMLRNPIEMMLSLHLHHVKNNYQPVEDFAGALELQAAREQSPVLRAGQSFRSEVSYRAVARYAAQVERFLDQFGSERVHVILFDELQADTAATFARILGFLGIRDDFRPDFRIHNGRGAPRSDKIDRAYLRLWRASGGLSRHLPKVNDLFASAYVRLERLNTVPTAAGLSGELRQQFQTESSDDIERLSQIIDRDLSPWQRSP